MVYRPPNSVENAIAAAIENASELSARFVQDSAGNIYWFEAKVSEDTGAVTYIYYDQPGGTVQVPVGDVSPVQDSNLQLEKRCDDVNGDGSVIIPFWRLLVFDEDGTTLSSRSIDAQGVDYVIQGNEIDCPEDYSPIVDAINARNSRNVSSFDQVVTADTNIPAGFLHASIFVVTGSADINGATYEDGEGLNLPPMSHGADQILYGQYQITNVTGEVRINYHV